jgi:hypothetical protein
MASYNGCSSPCPLLPQWSNPDVLFQGEPTGIPGNQSNSADNARTLNNTRGTVAGFRPAVAVEDETPDPEGISPANASGATQTFVATFSDPNGAEDILAVSLLVNSAVSATNACYVIYFPSSRQFFLLNDTGSAWAGPIRPGSGVAANSQCALNGAGASATLGGDTLTVAFPLTAGGFSGTQQVFLRAEDKAGHTSGWESLGAWNVTGQPAPQPGPEPEPNPDPVIVSVTPGAGSGGSATFTAVIEDGNGAGDVRFVEFLLNAGLSAPNACFAVYDAAARTFWLLNDSATGWIGPVTPSSNAAGNGQCLLGGPGLAAVLSGNRLNVSLPLTFRNFTGTKQIFAGARDQSGASTGWQQFGTFTVQ